MAGPDSEQAAGWAVLEPSNRGNAVENGLWASIFPKEQNYVLKCFGINENFSSVPHQVLM